MTFIDGVCRYLNWFAAQYLLLYFQLQGHGVKTLSSVWSNSQDPVCSVVKRSSNKNDGQFILTPVTAVTTAPM